MGRKLTCLTVAFAASLPLLAHHSFAAEYDSAQPLTVRGTVNHVDSVNPHSWVYVDITGPDRKVTK